MTETVTHRISVEGADLLSLTGVNDLNLLELERSTGVRASLRGDHVTLAGAIEAVEQAVLDTEGDFAAKLMAAMEAARKMGGDGRCSSKTGSPTSCGAPPKTFTKSSDIGFMMIGRHGDTDGTCGGAGCATGQGDAGAG